MSGIVGLLLAAGRSQRFAADKRLHLLDDGRPLLIAAAQSLASVCARTAVVIRPDDDVIARLLAGHGLEAVVCIDAEHGVGHSLAAGVAATRDASGWLIALADMPWIQPDSHRRVYDALRAGARIARPFYQGQPGHPVGFAAEFGERLLTLRGDEGARRLIAAVPGALQGCPVDDPGVLRDVDTPAALDAAVPCFAGSRELRVDDAVQGVSFPVVALYPTHTASETRRFGPYLMDTAADAPIAAGRFPLVAISHGTGGSHLLYRSLATHLAQNGYVVALIEHPGNNRNDNALAGSDENLLNRPRHVRLALDAVAGATALAGSVDGGQAAVIGHSLGGYTALALAGGIPWTQSGRRLEGCPDARIRALVLLAPATAWYGHPDSLKQVSVPILMLSAEHDAYTPGWHADIVRNGVPERARVSSRVVAKAGHFSFLSPFPPALRNPTFLPSTDPEGFDREAFHAQLPGEVLRFLDRVLKDRRPS